MSILAEERLSDSPYVASISFGHTVRDGSTIRPSISHWHMVLRKLHGKVDLLVVGPLTSASPLSYTEGAELLWIKFKLGTFLPHLPTKLILDKETELPGATRQSFWLSGSAWQFPDYENADTFVNRLARAGVLAYDPLVNAVLEEEQKERAKDVPERTLRYRFARSTGLSASYIRQMRRAQHASTLLKNGVSILDTVDEAGYFDQAHLTKSLKQFIGYTPAQISRLSPHSSHKKWSDEC
ncbi:AraC family transcriptional regulator [Ktedonosporobacter rubrisoli]|uniref:AraC family transcriptional regulator n=1 Tax=Ktedonosporobacter rubrisoli TaxID=2509675 RepID=A0A4P6JK15_KTERU|nr:helix-turn-helix domain-containing protein [Ktedonosporobacter rubrisoli]QBD75507.1 AraC family transcriptional regulator [Ktedonosporobacter rubrisoli]